MNVVKATLAILAVVTPSLLAAEGADSFRVFSWNISDASFVREPEEFAAVLGDAQADIYLLDEVFPQATSEQLRASLANIESDDDATWNIDYGVSGGPQRVVVVAKLPLETVKEFDQFIPIPESDRNTISRRMTAPQRENPALTMNHGIAVNGAIVTVNNKRLLIVGTDLQCCGDGPGSWQEYRRRVEAREIRQLVQRVLHRRPVDGIIIAGDFNVVETPLPLSLASGPYSSPHHALIAAEAVHADGVTTWTWYGEGTPFPSRAIDFQLYSPASMRVLKGLVLDRGHELSEHRPIVIDYRWMTD